ncbi:MAG: SEC-C domain-containing protein [Magnetococcales bacterium]|nr:SEC-C domain-containing protein [Magnetococcales bacterium]
MDTMKPIDLNTPGNYAEALAKAAMTEEPHALAMWLAGEDEGAVEGPFGKWYLYFAERLMDMAPNPAEGFASQPTQSVAAPTIGRNDLCPCGSGKKFKKCHIGNEGAAAWRLGSPTQEIKMEAVARLIHMMPMEALESVPVEKCSSMVRTEILNVFHAAGRLEEATTMLKTVLEGKRSDPNLLYDYWIARYAEWLVELDRAKEAESFLMDEYDNPNKVKQWQVAQKLAAFYIDQGDPDSAETWIETSLEGDEENPFTHYLKGLMYHTLSQYEPAVEAYEQAIRYGDRFRKQEQEYMVRLVEEALLLAKEQKPLDGEDEGA